jgi:endonuclease-3 related protein
MASLRELQTKPPSGPKPDPRLALTEYYNSLFCTLGPQHWWPGKSRFEVIVGTILTQSTAWRNVERAISNLRTEKMLTPGALERVTFERLARLLRPSGYFRQKARKLKAFAEFLRKDFQGSLARMFRTPTAELRRRLLDVHGIGPETADSILLYAGGHPVFVVDAYTKRILVRHSWVGEKSGYEEMREFFENNFDRDAAQFNEFHALIVQTGKRWCRPREPLCGECPLGRFLEEGR